ncbi:MAG TPA: hypothetical protein VJA21_20725 [Verrucomicrobiae bacterium]
MLNPANAVPVIVAALGLAPLSWGRAATVQTLGTGSAVALVERAATFDSLTSTDTRELGNYSEGGLYVATGNQSWGADPPLAARLDPFHGATAPDRGFFCVAWDNPEWTSIRTTNMAVIHAVEFVYGNGWTTGDIYGQYPWGNNAAILIWQTWLNGTLVSSGSAGGAPMLPVGTVVGFYDPTGFDELTLKAIMLTAADTNSNALALDNVMVQLTNQPPAPVIYGEDFSFNPTNQAASLRVWGTLSGAEYRLVYAEDLASTTWSPVTPPLPDGWVPGGGDLMLTDPGAPGRPHRFYRVEAR